MKWKAATILFLVLSAVGYVLATGSSAAGHTGLLIVYLSKDRDMMERGQKITTGLQQMRDQAGYTSENLPILRYYFDESADGQRFLRQRLGIQGKDLPFLAVVTLDRGEQPERLLARYPKVRDLDKISKEVVGKLKAGSQTGETSGDLPPEIKNPKDGSILELVAGGDFVMGSDSYEEDEKPPHKINVRAFYMSKFLVTNAQFRRFASEAQQLSPSVKDWLARDRNQPGRDDLPAVNVSYWDAQAYCEWAELRLPNEAEWEKAARGPSPRDYPWGNEPIVQNAVVKDSSSRPVGSKPAGVSPYGCLDMAGNVWEWSSTVFARDYLKDPRGGAESLVSSQSRSLRGGCWRNADLLMLRTSSRHAASPKDVRNTTIGFRAAKSP